MSEPPPEQARLASDSERNCELELELRRLRAAAAAARFEARAAEIELLLRRTARRAPTPSAPSAPSVESPGSWDPLDSGGLNRLPINDWQELLQAASLWHAPAAEHALAFEDSSAAGECAEIGERGDTDECCVAGERADVGEWFRTDELARIDAVASLAAQPAISRSAAASEKTTTALAAIEKASDAGQETDEPPPRRRPAAWIVSTLAHAAVLMILAATTISIADPKDHIALKAATPPAQEPTIETVPLKQVEQPEEAAPQPPLPIATEPSPIGTITASEIEVEAPELTAPRTGSLDSLLGIANPLAEGSPELNSQFFGVQVGGNHFVYLVDNSGSMASVARDGFDVARQELLQSIAALKADQRFYVIFFGEEMLRMRISDPHEPEPRSVHATAENKAALERWAMGITMQPGRWPEKPLEFAFQLRPDVIFLLTDGEMSQKVEPMIRKHNLVESLFDGPRPRSIIHTIGFYSRDGAEQMRKIALANGGTYRFVPPPPKR